MLSFKQAWDAIVTGKVSAQSGGVAIDTTPITEEAQKQESENKTITPTGFSEKAGLSSKNPNPELLPDENTITDDERIFGALSYFPFISFFVIGTRKDSLFISYHAWQGFTFFVLFVISLPVYWLFSIIPGMSFLFWFFYLFLFGGGFWGSFMAWSGKYISFPFISSFAQKLSATKQS